MIFDTLAFLHRLKAAGFTDAQAEALAEANREMFADEMVTKSFLQSELSAAINQLRAEFRAEMKELGMWLTLRMGATGVAIVAALAAIIKF